MAKGKMIIAANHGSLGDIVEKNHLGYTFESENIEALKKVFAHGYLTLEDDTLMQWWVDNDFCGEAAKAVRYDSDFVWEGESWPEGAYIISEKDRNAVRLENFCGR